MAFKVFFVLSALVCCGLAARITRDAPQEEDLLAKAFNDLKSAGEHIKTMLGAKNGDLETTLKDGAKTLGENLDNAAKDIQKRISDLANNKEAQEGLEKVKTALAGISQNITEGLKDVTGEKVVENIKETLKTLSEKAKNLAEDPQVAKATKTVQESTAKVIETITQAVTDLNKQLSGSTKPANAKSGKKP